VRTVSSFKPPVSSEEVFTTETRSTRRKRGWKNGPWILALLFVLISLPCTAQMVTVTASHIADRGAPLAAGTWCATPMGAAGKGFHVGSTGNVTGSPVCRDVVSGVIATTLGGVEVGALPLADTSLTAPLHVAYGITIRDANGAYVLGGPLSGYTSVQPSANNSWCAAGVCNWDLYLPTIANLPLAFPIIWGGIGGTLSDQADLWAALEAAGGVRTQSDWAETDDTLADFIKHKPTIPAAQIQSDWTEANTALLDYIKNKPSIPAGQVNSDWDAVSGLAEILHKPTIPAAQEQSDWNEANNGLPDFIKNKPSIPAGQVNSDWDAVSGLAEILHKPTIPAAQIQSDYTQANNLLPDYIKNKPSAYTTSDPITLTGSAFGLGVGAGVALDGGTPKKLTTVGQQPAQISASFIGVPANGQIILLIPLTFAVTVPTGCTNSHLDGLVAVTASTTFTMYYLTGGIGGTPTSFGTAVIASGNSATFTCSSGHAFSAGDYLEVKGPATADATFANIGFGLYGVR
jgi:hypothetical protein